MMVVTSRALCGRPFLEQMELIAEAGPEMVVLREKDLTVAEYRDLASRCLGICGRHGVPLSLNTHVEVARDLGIGRVHLPMDVLRGADVSGFELVGASVHSKEEAVEAESLGADYVIAGHVFATACKDSEPRGLAFLRDVCSSVDVPVYGIGGITPENCGDAISAGARGVAVMSSMMVADDPSGLISRFAVNPGMRSSVMSGRAYLREVHP